MAEKTIKVASFPYAGEDGVERTALRGDTVNLGDADVKRGERLGAFATDDDLAEGSAFRDFLTARQVTPPDTDVDGGADGSDHASNPAVDPPPATRPRNSASREDWAAYATGAGAPAEETRPVDEGGLTRDQLRDKYGTGG